MKTEIQEIKNYIKSIGSRSDQCKDRVSELKIGMLSKTDYSQACWHTPVIPTLEDEAGRSLQISDQHGVHSELGPGGTT